MAKSIHPKIFKNTQLGIEEADFANIWMNWFCQVRFLKRMDFISPKFWELLIREGWEIPHNVYHDFDYEGPFIYYFD